jgi:amidase
MVSRTLVGAGYDPALRDPWTRGLARRGQRALLRLPLVLRRLRAAVARERAAFGAVDVVLSPVTSTPAPRLGHLAGSVPFDTLFERISTWMAFTPIQNVAGTPAIAVPSSPASTGLPIGVQLAGLAGDERLLLSLALELEESDPWPRLAPSPVVVA